jgi:hypothetical protein
MSGERAGTFIATKEHRRFTEFAETGSIVTSASVTALPVSGRPFPRGGMPTGILQVPQSRRGTAAVMAGRRRLTRRWNGPAQSFTRRPFLALCAI